MAGKKSASRKRKERCADGRRALKAQKLEAEALRAKANRFRDAKIRWEDKIDMIESAIRPFEHPKGKPRTPEQNVMVAQTCIGLMKDALEAAIQTGEVSCLSVQTVDQVAADVHKFKRQHVTTIRNILKDEQSLVTAIGDPSTRGGGTEKYQHKYTLSPEQQEFCYSHIEEQHAKGAAVTNRGGSAGGLPRQRRRPSSNAERTPLTSTFLIRHSEALKDPDVVLVYIDESYICKGHGKEYSYFDKDMEFYKASGKGRRLIILHAMTKDGLL